MRIFAIAPHPISATNKKQYNQNTFQGKIPKSANVADTFQKSVDKIAEEKRVNQLWNTARLFRYCFFKPVYINQVENLQAKFDKFKEKMYNFCNKICRALAHKIGLHYDKDDDINYYEMESYAYDINRKYDKEKDLA